MEAFYHAYPYRKYEKETKHIEIKEFNNLYDEVEQVAKDIVHLVRETKRLDIKILQWQLEI